MAGGGPVNQGGSQSGSQMVQQSAPPGAQTLLSNSMQNMRRISPFGSNNAGYPAFPSPYRTGNPYSGMYGGGGNPFSGLQQQMQQQQMQQPEWMQQAQQAQQNFTQSAPYIDFMNKQKALQQEFENSQGYKDFQTQMQGFQKQQQEYTPPFSPYGGMYGGLGRMFF